MENKAEYKWTIQRAKTQFSKRPFFFSLGWNWQLSVTDPLTVSDFQRELFRWSDEIPLQKLEAKLSDEDIKQFIEHAERIINVSKPTIVAAANRGAKFFRFFLNSPKLSASITAEITLAAIRCGADILRVLLDTLSTDIKPTETLVAAAARQGPKAIGLLLDKRGSEITITDIIVQGGNMQWTRNAWAPF